MTLYAHWLPVEYTITYELNGGENDPNNPGSYNVESGDVIFNEPTREGYYFVLWEMTGIENATNDGFIPEGSVGDVIMTAIWEPVTYIISYDIVRGETEQPNPAEYTIESADIVLSNPSAEKYEFTGWTGTDLAEPNLEVIIPAGSTGDRSFKANWITTDPIGRIIETALAAIPDEYAEDISSFTGIQDIEAAVLNAVAEDETCSGYLDQLSVSVAQSGDVVEDGASYTYNVQVTVSFTDDSGSVTSDSKNVVLTVMKNPVTITASVSYPEGLLYIPYGTTLADVALGDCTATAGGELIDGIFAWADSIIVPLGADNGMEMYKVVFTPTDTASYSTAETLIAVNAQIGLQIVIDALDTEYMGRALDASECSYYAIDIDTGEKIDDVTLSITGAVIEQSQIKPGTNVTVKLTGFDACEIQSNTDNALYALVGTETGDTITITRATPTLSGAQEYTAEYGSVLRNIELDLKAGTATGILDVAGTFEWTEPAAILDTIGSAVYAVIFTPDELDCYNTATIEVTVSVGKKPVEVPRIESVLYDGTHKIAEVPESELYSPI